MLHHNFPFSIIKQIRIICNRGESSLLTISSAFITANLILTEANILYSYVFSDGNKLLTGGGGVRPPQPRQQTGVPHGIQLPSGYSPTVVATQLQPLGSSEDPGV